MERRHDLDAAAEGMGAAAKPRDGRVGLQQHLGRERPERHDDLRLNRVNLLQKERTAGLDIDGLGVAVVRRTTLDDVGNIDVAPRERDGFDDLREELPCTPDERFALLVFIGSRRFPDEHQLGLWIPYAEHHLLAALLEERAPRAVPDVLADGGEGGGGVRGTSR